MNNTKYFRIRSSMAYKRQCGAKMVDKMFKVFVALNVLCQFCPCRTSVDIGGQSKCLFSYLWNITFSVCKLSNGVVDTLDLVCCALSSSMP